MQRYKEFRPTQFDNAGAFLHDQSEWIVAPVIQTRDSGPLDQSNFAACLKALGGESDNVQVHRFGHWGTGWFEIIIINPECADLVETAESIESALADYPVLDEMDYSEREFNKASDYWFSMSIRDRIHACAKYDVSIFAARRDEIPEDSTGELISYLTY